MDGRRSRWIAFDVMFYGNDLGVNLRHRFGAPGLVLFTAFLCACKRNAVPGKFRYLSDEDALAQLGVPGMSLVNEFGDAYTLDMFWTYLGQHKMTSRRRRGHITEITATRWEHWQHDFQRQTEREQKARSRTTNTRTKPGQYSDDTRTDKTRHDKTTTTTPDVVVDDRYAVACRRYAEKQAEAFKETIIDREAWLAERTANLMEQHTRIALDNPQASTPELLLLIQGGTPRKPSRTPCGACGDKGVVELEDGTAEECACKQKKTA